MRDDAELLDAGHLYAPHFWHGAKPWKPKPGQCRHAVSDEGRWPSYHQCGRKTKVTRTVKHHGEVIEVEYCGQHDPVVVKAKADARTAKWRAKWDARDAAEAEKRRFAALHADALAALKQIANGHNDPRSLALEVLTKQAEEV